MQGLKPSLKRVKIKMFKNMRKREPQQKCSRKKSTPKTPNIRKITGVPKSKNFR